MNGERRTGRPLRALAVLAALIAGWIAGRWPMLQISVTDAVVKAERAQLLADAAERPSPRATPSRAAAELAYVARHSSAQLARGSMRVEAEQVSLDSVSVRLSRRSSPPRRRGSIHVQRLTRMDPRLRGGDDAIWMKPTSTADPALTVVAGGMPPTSAVPATASISPAGKLMPQSALPRAAFSLATHAYAALTAGNRRVAAQDFDAALLLDNADPHAAAWAVARHKISKRWSGSAYVFARPGSSSMLTTPASGTAPLLGGSQSGAALAFALDPLARRPLDLTARATGSTSLGQRQAEAALGVRWRLLPGISLSAERLIALGTRGRRDWTVRLAGGRTGKIGPMVLDSFGETGIVGFRHPAYFAAGQVRAGYPVAVSPAITLTPGAGVWSGIQRHQPMTVDRVDLGPSLRLHWARATLPIDLALDYRRQVAGKAAPGSGAALTLSTGF